MNVHVLHFQAMLYTLPVVAFSGPLALVNACVVPALCTEEPPIFNPHILLMKIPAYSPSSVGKGFMPTF
jgi:hypothetical protein